jgi:hypothetical protein
MERHIENPCNFCRAEAYPGTGLETRLAGTGSLLGDLFGYDYRLTDVRCEAFHQIANFAFFDRNFNDLGLHYFNMQVDFYFQLLRGSTSTVYDHTSVLASLKVLFNLPEFLTRRDAAAATVEHLVLEKRRGDDETPAVLPRIAAAPSVRTTAAMTSKDVDATLNQRSAAKLSEFQQSLVDLAKQVQPPASDPRAEVARLAVAPSDEHSAAVHVRQATQQFLGG